MPSSLRKTLLRRLKRLPPGALDEVILLAHVPVEYLSGGVSAPATRIAEIIRWAEIEEERLAALEDALDEVEAELGGGIGRSSVAERLASSTSAAPSPASAPAPVVAPPTPLLRWLHLSDLHFGHGDAHHRFDQKAVTGAILDDAEKMAATHGPPDAVFITGDVAFSAQSDQYTSAGAFLTQLQAAVGVGPDKIFIVPGNHDVDRKAAASSLGIRKAHKLLRLEPRDLDDYLAEPSELATTLWPKLESYAHFSGPYGSGPLSPEQPFWIRRIKDTPKPIIAVGLNTCLLSFDSGDAPSNLALGKGQLQAAISDQPKDALIVVLMHHPPGWLVDGSELESFLKLRPHVLLCGHVHADGGLFASTMDGGGISRFTAGAGHADQQEAGKHAFAWGELSTEGLRFWPRTYVDGVKIFKANTLSYDLHDRESHLVKRTRTIPPVETWLNAVAETPTPEEPDAPDTGGADSEGEDPELPPHPLNKVHTLLKQELGNLAGFFTRLGGPTTLDEVYVDVCLQDRAWDAKGRVDSEATHGQGPNGELGLLGLHGGRPFKLREIIDLPHKRWVLLGDPGSGKTTLFHRLSTELMGGLEEGQGGRSPLFFKLSELEGGWGLREATQRLYSPEAVAPVLEAAGRGDLVILLDGLDEAVDPGAARRAIAAICAEASGCQVIVTSRYTGYQDHPLAAPFETLTLRPLEEPQQRRLLGAWGIESARITTTLQHLHGRPRLRAIAETPLLLTLVALVLREKPDATLPSRRGELYKLALSQFLLREFSPNHPGEKPRRALRSPEVAEEALGVVALELHGQEGASYPARDIRRALKAHTDLFKDIKELWGSKRDPEGVGTFLAEVAECTGIIEPDTDSRGASKAWRFPHRTFREYLAAWALSQDITASGLGEVPRDALEGAGREKREGKAAKAPGKLGDVLKAAAEHPATWSEVLALTCGLEKPTGADLIVRWVALTGNPELVLRVVAEAENIREDTVWAVLGLEKGGHKWKQRKEVLEQLPALVRDGSAVIRLVDKFLRQTTNGNDLYFAQELLQQLAAGEVEGDGAFILTEGDRAQAAALAGDVLKRHRPEAREEAKAILEEHWIPIEGGRFRMGSEDGRDNEKPVHPVTLSSYRLQKVPVTNALYERFDPGHRQERSFADRVNDAEELDRHPVVDVTWYEARMFAEWAGVSLPTEAQWEYGARGRERRKYPWGDGEPNEELSCFGRKYSEGSTDPVGAHPRGASWCRAQDLAGNVLEWCGDWYDPYDPTQTDNPRGPLDGADRVMRGGFWCGSTDGLRGAYRNGGLPGSRSDLVGFRLAAPRSLP